MARPKKLETDVKATVISLRLTDDHLAEVEELRERLEKSTGVKVSRATAIMKLIELGTPVFKRRYRPR